MVLQIRNMESDLCIEMVKNELSKLGVNYKRVELGKVEVKEIISVEKLQLIDKALRGNGLELLVDQKVLIIENIKDAVHQMIHVSDDISKLNISDFISKKVNHSYPYLSSLFSATQGITIEKYLILQKIERVKELLVYGEFSLSDIAYKLQYSSVAHLSNQFKKITGLTPSFFRQLRNKMHRKSKNVRII
jgi:AraC-like DNA-binding protein